MQEMPVPSLGRQDPLEEGMATHSSILAWRMPWTEEPGGLPSIALQRVGHYWSNLARNIFILNSSNNPEMIIYVCVCAHANTHTQQLH